MPVQKHPCHANNMKDTPPNGTSNCHQLQMYILFLILSIYLIIAKIVLAYTNLFDSL